MARSKTRTRTKGPRFDFRPGRQLEGRYIIGDFLGSGFEGEVYQITEEDTGIERVVKFFYPDRFPDKRRSIRMARKLHRLRDCNVVLQYHHHGHITRRGERIGYMVSELARGTPLTEMLERQHGQRFPPFEALHLVYSIVRGVADMHALREYHGDIHLANILVHRRGIGFRIKLIDLHLYPSGTTELRHFDVVCLTGLLYELIGGPAAYSGSPEIVKKIVCGRRRQLIKRRFPNAGALCDFMDTYPWNG